MSKKKLIMKTSKSTKEKNDLGELHLYGSVDFFQMKRVFPVLVQRILKLETKLKSLQKKTKRVGK